ncbi:MULTISPECIES: response regulator [unclassified Coleofasciculus]|uniref:response regulator n=1 Tax=unclassified Coleofasciculus TaxID=2692782 RepID=UPI00187E226F|nr:MULTISPECIES: response regulator [unclassified Coleofasciculus]MBE9125256.1 response regulator [Coleofasciculus sp. LEGE 07081]MBE9148391.1 response regulator [Coleofasciculus sp. LEGE 07092]
MSTILVIEDSVAQLALMNLYLRDSGHKIISLKDSKEALNTAVKEKPHVIITDVVMPEINGFELCRRLKTHPATASIPIVICSSKNQEVDRIWGMKQGASAYLPKPFSRDQFIEIINQVRFNFTKTLIKSN